jgi:hypothetical protein
MPPPAAPDALKLAGQHRLHDGGLRVVTEVAGVGVVDRLDDSREVDGVLRGRGMGPQEVVDLLHAAHVRLIRDVAAVLGRQTERQLRVTDGAALSGVDLVEDGREVVEAAELRAGVLRRQRVRVVLGKDVQQVGLRGQPHHAEAHEGRDEDDAGDGTAGAGGACQGQTPQHPAQGRFALGHHCRAHPGCVPLGLPDGYGLSWPVSDPAASARAWTRCRTFRPSLSAVSTRSSSVSMLWSRSLRAATRMASSRALAG